VIYYQLAAAGSTIPTYSALKSSIPSLVGQNATASAAASPFCQTETDPQTGETWTDFQHRLYRTHLKTTQSGAIAMYTTTSSTPLTFTCLASGTSYQLIGYLDNLGSGTDPAVHTESPFSTTKVDSPQPIALKFGSIISDTYKDKVAQATANVINVNPKRLYAGNTTNSRRELDTTATYTTFTYTLVPNRFGDGPAPSDQAKITGTALTTLTTALSSVGTLSAVTNPASPTPTAPTWVSSPASGGATANSVTVALRASVAGTECCVALTGSATAPTPDQVMLGVDSANQAASYTCIATDISATTNSVVISSLQAGTTYYVYCTATDNYPLWPTPMTYSTTNPLTAVSITTLSTTPIDTTSASYFGGLFLLLAFLLH
jgi:hypothetical protein